MNQFGKPVYRSVIRLTMLGLATFIGPFLMVFGVTIFVPLLPVLSIYFDVSPGVIGFIPTAGNLGLLIFIPLWGYISPRKDPLYLFPYSIQFWILGLILGILGLIVGSLPLSILGRFIQGAAEGGLYFLALKIVETYAPMQERPRYSGRLETSAALGGIAGPIVGVVVPNMFLGLVVPLSFGAAGLILVMVSSRNISIPAEPIKSFQTVPIKTSTIISSIPLGMVGFSIFFAFGVIITFLGFLFERFAIPGVYAGWLASGAQIILAISSFLAGKYTLHIITEKRVILVGLLLLAICFYVLGVSQSIMVSILLVLSVFFLFGHLIPSTSIYSFSIAQKVGPFAITFLMFFRSLGQLLSVQYLSFSFLDISQVELYEVVFRNVYQGTGIVVILAFFLLRIIPE